MFATKIKMKPGERFSQSVLEIDEIFLDDYHTYFKKEWVHDFVKKYPGSVAVGIHPYPALIPVTSVYGEKYVRSKANDSPDDNLLALPRE